METIKQDLGKWIAAYKNNGYLHGSILVAKGEELLVNEGFYLANIEHQAANSPKTKFRIGSITKGFTAMAIFQLYSEKKLDIHASISKYLPNYPKGSNITIYHCLTNTSGIPNFTGATDFWTRTMRLPLTMEEVIDSFKQAELEFEPGTEYSYSSSGYLLLTAIIENISEKTFEQYMREHIFMPLEMEDTGVDNGRTIVPGLASGYSYWETTIHADYADMSFPLGGYGLYSTTEDLLKWSRSLMRSDLIGKEMTAELFQPYHNSYACGWSVSQQLDRNCISHFGDISGFANNFLQFTNDQTTIIFLSNMNVTPVMTLTRDLANLLYGEPTHLPEPLISIDMKLDEALCGTYIFENDRNKSIKISIKENFFFVTVSKMYGALYKFKLIPTKQQAGAVTFMTEMINEKLTFHFNKAHVIHVEYTDCYGNVYLLKQQGVIL